MSAPALALEIPSAISGYSFKLGPNVTANQVKTMFSTIEKSDAYWVDKDFIRASDPTTFEGLTYVGGQSVEMFDRRIDGWSMLSV